MRVEQMLRAVLGSCRSIHARRALSFSAAVAAVISAGQLTLTAIGRSYRSSTPKHGIKRADRLVGNFKLWGERLILLRALAGYLVRGVARPTILIDWTSVGDGTRQCALVAAVPFAGRAIPILFEVHSLRRYGRAEVHRRFLHRLSAVLPQRCSPIIVADAGFKMPFYRAVAAFGWGYVIRVRGSNRRFGPLRMSDLLGRALAAPKDLGTLPLLQRDGFGPRLVLGPKSLLRRRFTDAHRRSAAEPWLLATNLHRHACCEIVAIYATRMRIEESLRDTKCARYGWAFDYARSRRAERLEMLLLVGAFATFVVTMIGAVAESRGWARQLQANTIRDRRVLSLFHVGRFVLCSSRFKLDLSTIRSGAAQLRCQLSAIAPRRANGFSLPQFSLILDGK